MKNEPETYVWAQKVKELSTNKVINQQAAAILIVGKEIKDQLKSVAFEVRDVG